MASVFGHMISAFGIGNLFPSRTLTAKVFLIGAISSVVPDIDVISNFFGIGGLHMLGHRGITHSLFFALIWSIILVIVFHNKDKLLLTTYYFICTGSHGVIDGLTNGGDGIAYFAPFSSYRTHLPYSVIQVSPLGVRNFFSEWGLRVLISEFFWITIPVIIIFIIKKIIQKTI